MPWACLAEYRRVLKISPHKDRIPQGIYLHKEIPPKTMKIVHYIPSIDRSWGGTSTYMQLLANPLGKMTELHILTHLSENPLQMKNCKVHFIPRYLPFSSTWKNAVAALFGEIKPDVVHINCCWTPDCAMIQKLAQKSGFKVVLTPHGMLEPWIVQRHYWTRKFPALMLYQKAAVQRADCIHATADSERDNLMKLGYNNNVKVVKLGIDAEGIAMKESWRSTKQILFLSRVHPKKGVNYLIEAAAVMREQLKDWRIIIAGEGEAGYIDNFKTQIHEEGLDDMVKLVGGVYGEEKWRLFQTSDFFVLPTHSENFGLAIAEALASGTPVITTHGAPWEDLNSYDSGACIEIGTQPLVETLREFVSSSEDDLERMGRNGRKLIEGKYSAQVMAKQMTEIYDSL